MKKTNRFFPKVLLLAVCGVSLTGPVLPDRLLGADSQHPVDSDPFTPAPLPTPDSALNPVEGEKVLPESGEGADEGNLGGKSWFIRLTAMAQLTSQTGKAGPGEYGYHHEGDDTSGVDSATFRLMGEGGLGHAAWEVHYLNHRIQTTPQAVQIGGVETPTGAEWFRYKPLGEDLEKPSTDPAHPATGQNVVWHHELDRAYLAVWGDGFQLKMGRQVIGWGAGRFWKPTDVFGTFSPTDPDTAYKPGVDSVVADVYPGEFSRITLAVVAHPERFSRMQNHTAMQFQQKMGDESEVSLLLAKVLGRGEVGLSVETAWLGAGWRLEHLTFENKPVEEAQVPLSPFLPLPPPPPGGEHGSQTVVGGDYRFSDGTLLLVEYSSHSLGADTEEELGGVAASADIRMGLQRQLSKRVLGVLLSRELTPLLQGSYAVFTSSLQDRQNQRWESFLHQISLTYSISDEAEAAAALYTANGRGLGPLGELRSEYGHLPNTFYARLRVYF
ncbi:MAG: hypothetical protein OEW12_00215 [Deltaproteobacteria bacterium]|nr:hypothetical protein [Deltaproteobacteria bacterium]